MSELCTHLDEAALRELPPSVDGCDECLRAGGKWLHLRICGSGSPSSASSINSP
jgi:hypothetical protein